MIDDGIGCRQAKVSQKMEAVFKGRETNGIEMMESKARED